MSCCYSPVEEKREISEGNGGQRVERHNGGWAVTMTVEAWVGLLSPAILGFGLSLLRGLG